MVVEIDAGAEAPYRIDLGTGEDGDDLAINFQVGTTGRFWAKFYDDDVLTDPTTVTFHLGPMQGPVVTLVYGVDPEMEKDSTGCYHVEYNLSAEGRMWFRWVGTGTVPATWEQRIIIHGSHLP